MATLTDAQLQADILLKIGDTPDLRLSTRMPTIWQLFAYLGAVPNAPLLQYWYATREAIDTWLGYVKEQVSISVSGEESTQLEQKSSNLRAMRADVDAEIAIIEEQALANRPSVAGVIAATTPESPPVGVPIPFPIIGPDANDSRYRGSVYIARTRV